MKFEEFSPKCQLAIEKARKIITNLPYHKGYGGNKSSTCFGIILGEGVTTEEAYEASCFLSKLKDASRIDK